MFGFFFSSRRRHTRWPRDWSSDVCSSDLTDGLGLDKVGIETDEKGFIPVNDELRTQVNNIYAIGDVVGGAMLAHKASDEAVMVVERLAGLKPTISYHLIPSVVYTWPEVAGVGYTEDQLKQQGIEYKVGKNAYMDLGLARARSDVA